MKKTGTEPRTLQEVPTYYLGGRSDGPAVAEPDNHWDLADLVWKYFSEDITEILTEAHKDLAVGAHNQLSKRK